MKILKLSTTRQLQEKKHYIILEGKERMYLSNGGLFASDKKYALSIDSHIIAATACVKLNELRKQQKQKKLCLVVFE